MFLMKKNDHHYLLIKLRPADSRFLKNFIKYNPPPVVKNAEELFQGKMALEIKAFCVITEATELEEEGRLPTEKVEEIIKSLDAPVNYFQNEINRNLEFVINYGKTAGKKKKNDVKIIDFKKLLKRRIKT